MKNTREGINSRLNDTTEQIYKPEDRIVEITEAEKKKKEIKISGQLSHFATTSSIQTFTHRCLKWKRKRERGREHI